MIDPKVVAEMATRYTAAWKSKSAGAVASFCADVPDLTLTCDELRVSGTHAIFVWSFTGHDAGTGNPLHVRGWEEWELTEDLKVAVSRGWFDADDYARQAGG